MRLVIIAALAASSSLLGACGTARDIEQSSSASSGCTSCHGLPPATGAHVAHLEAGTFALPLACSSCHLVPTSLNHLDGRIGVDLGALASQGVTDPGYAGGTCATYCHGSTAQLGDTRSPAWTSTAGVACGSCHGLQPTSGLHELHRNPPSPFAPVACESCHPGYSTAPATVNLATHLNGSFEASPVTTTATFSSWPSGPGLGACTACHGAAIPGL